MKEVLLFTKGNQRIDGFELAYPPPLGCKISITTITDGVLGADWYRVVSGFVNVSGQIEMNCDYLGFSAFSMDDYYLNPTQQMHEFAEKIARDFAGWIANTPIKGRTHDKLWQDYIAEYPLPKR